MLAANKITFCMHLTCLFHDETNRIQHARNPGNERPTPVLVNRADNQEGKRGGKAGVGCRGYEMKECELCEA